MGRSSLHRLIITLLGKFVQTMKRGILSKIKCNIALYFHFFFNYYVTISMHLEIEPSIGCASKLSLLKAVQEVPTHPPINVVAPDKNTYCILECKL